jgi:F-type H+-transporting ATPase subunit gamma
VIGDYTSIFTNLSFDAVREAAEYAMTGFTNREFDQVELIYNEFKNVATQIVRTEQFLPLEDKPAREEQSSAVIPDYTFEPSKEDIIQELIPKSLKIQVYKAVLESNASEHGARMTAMDKATENAGELLKELKLTYNRTRQAAITKEILEIVGGAEALAAK